MQIVGKLLCSILWILCTLVSIVFAIRLIRLKERIRTYTCNRTGSESEEEAKLYHKQMHMELTGSLLSGFIAIVGFLFSYNIPIPQPYFFPSDCEFSHPSPYEIQIEADPYVEIYYTLNGEHLPQQEGNCYEGPITLTKNTAVVAQSKFLCFWSEPAQVNCTVYDADQYPEGVDANRIELQQRRVELYVGDMFPLSVDIFPENAIPPILEWESSDDHVVAVNDEGILTARETGSAVVTVKVGVLNLSSHCDVIVRERNSQGLLPAENHSGSSGSQVHSTPVSRPNVPISSKESSFAPVSSKPWVPPTHQTDSSYVHEEEPSVPQVELPTTSTVPKPDVVWPEVSSSSSKIPESSSSSISSSTPSSQPDEPPYLVRIDIQSLPEKTVYSVGDRLDLSGFALLATYSNGATSIVKSGFTCTPMKLETAGTQAIRVYYGQKETSFSVVVQEDPIEILAYRVEKAYQDASVLQSAFSVSFTTNVAFQDATLEIDGMSAECPMRNSTEGMQSFDRKYFSKPSYDITLKVTDNSGNQDEVTFTAELGEVDIMIEPTQAQIAAGEDLELVADVLGIAGHSVRWSSSDPSVASVSDHKVLGKDYSSATVSGKKKGQATITATVAGKEASCTVTVH